MRSTRNIILPCMLSLLTASESVAVPAPPERNLCKKCVDDCLNNGAREHARCFVESGELTAAQSYCLRRLLGNFDYPGGGAIDPWTMDRLSGLVQSCVDLYRTSDEPRAELNLSPERFEHCRLTRFYYSESCAPDGKLCKASCPPRAETDFGTEADPGGADQFQGIPIPLQPVGPNAKPPVVPD